MSEFWVPPRSSDLGNRLAEGEAGFCLNRRAASAPMPRPSVLGSGVRASPRPGVEPPAVVHTRAPLCLRGSGVRPRGGGRWRGVWVDCGAHAQRWRFSRGCAVTGAKPSARPPAPVTWRWLAARGYSEGSWGRPLRMGSALRGQVCWPRRPMPL